MKYCYRFATKKCKKSIYRIATKSPQASFLPKLLKFISMKYYYIQKQANFFPNFAVVTHFCLQIKSEVNWEIGNVIVKQRKSAVGGPLALYRPARPRSLSKVWGGQVVVAKRHFRVPLQSKPWTKLNNCACQPDKSTRKKILLIVQNVRVCLFQL